MLLTIDPASSLPLFEQLVTAVRGQIIAGGIRAGERLPSARALAESLDINLHTVLRAYQILRDEGFLDLRRGRGAVVVDRTRDYDQLHRDIVGLVAEAKTLELTPGALSALIRGGLGEMIARTRMIIVGVAAPLAISLFGVLAVILSLPYLPDPIAVHWGMDGTPDSFGSPAGFPVLIAVAALLWAAFAWAISRTMGASGKPTVNQRLILAVGWFLSIVLTVTLAGSVQLQRGLEDARDAPSILPLLLAGFGGGILLSVVAWFALPASAPEPVLEDASLPVMDLTDTQRGTWMQHVAPQRAVAGFLVVVMALAVSLGGFGLWFTAPLWFAAGYIVLMVALTVMSVASLYWHVRVDARGFVASSVIGFPRFTIPLEQVAAAAQIDVRAGRDFGGWGVRWGGRRRFGVITRSGEALEVRRKDGRAVVVTVSQAESGAALLNSLAGRLH